MEEAQEDVQGADRPSHHQLRTLHMGIALLNMCIQRSGAGDGPTSVVLGFLVVECIDNIKPLIHEKQLKFCYFWILAGSVLMLEGGAINVPHPTRSTRGGCSSHVGGVGEQVCSGGNAVEDFGFF